MIKTLLCISILFYCCIKPLQTCAQSMRDSVSREDKIYALSLIWKEVDYNFAFFDMRPDLNWDSLYTAYIPKILATKNVYEYVKVLGNFMKTLKDGHTGVYLNQPYWDEIDSPPIRFEKRENKRIVTFVDSVMQSQVPVGSEIVRLNGKTWDDFLNGPDLENNDWFGFRGTQIELTILKPNNKESKVIVIRNINQLFRSKKLSWMPKVVSVSGEDFEFKSISPIVAYVNLATFGDSAVVTRFKAALPDIRKHQALIIDLRKNSGGNDDYALQIAQYLTDQPFIVGSRWKTRVNNSAKKAWAARGDTSLSGYLHRNVWEKHAGDTMKIAPDFPKLNMPIYLLTSKKTFSAAEDFLIYLNYSGNVTRIGQTTGGSSGQPLEFKLPHGFTARVCAKADEFPDGTQFINIGIKPQIAVEPSTDGKDAELNKTLNIIQGKK